METPVYNDLYDRLIRGDEKLALVGLGYVGMPIAVEFAKHVKVIGFNHNEYRIQQYKSGIDPTNEVGNEVISKATVDFTSDEKRLAEAKFIIVAVLTPVKDDNNPDLGPVENASRIIGRNMVPGTIVVYESTVYPGVTEDICIPILEKESRLKCGVDFKIGYSLERINPGDRVHITLKKCPDTRNSKVNDIIKRLEEYDIVPLVTDPWADPEIAKHEYGVDLIPFDEVRDADCIIVAVGHKEFRSMSMMQLKSMFKDVPDDEKILIDVKSLYRMDELKASGMRLWRL